MVTSAMTRAMTRAISRGVHGGGGLGPELIVMGNFATSGPTVVVDGDEITYTSAASGQNASQSISTEASAQYQFTFEMTEYTEGGVRAEGFAEGQLPSGLGLREVAVYEETVTASSGTTNLIFRAFGTTTAKITNISLRKIIA